MSQITRILFPVLLLWSGHCNAIETLEVSGATTIQSRVLEPIRGAFQSATGIMLKIYGPGTGKGMIALLDGKVPVAAAGEALEDALESAKAAAVEAGRPIDVPKNLVYHELVPDDIVVVVHATNTLKALDKEQVRRILSGQVSNWREVGGADLPIKVYVPAKGQAVRSAMVKAILGGADVGGKYTEIRTAAEQLRVIGADPAGIGAMSESVTKASSERVRVVPGTVIHRPMGFVTVGRPTPAVQSLIDFVKSPDGKRLIK